MMSPLVLTPSLPYPDGLIFREKSWPELINTAIYAQRYQREQSLGGRATQESINDAWREFENRPHDPNRPRVRRGDGLFDSSMNEEVLQFLSEHLRCPIYFFTLFGQSNEIYVRNEIEISDPLFLVQIGDFGYNFLEVDREGGYHPQTIFRDLMAFHPDEPVQDGADQTELMGYRQERFYVNTKHAGRGHIYHAGKEYGRPEGRENYDELYSDELDARFADPEIVQPDNNDSNDNDIEIRYGMEKNSARVLIWNSTDNSSGSDGRGTGHIAMIIRYENHYRYISLYSQEYNQNRLTFCDYVSSFFGCCLPTMTSFYRTYYPRINGEEMTPDRGRYNCTKYLHNHSGEADLSFFGAIAGDSPVFLTKNRADTQDGIPLLSNPGVSHPFPYCHQVKVNYQDEQGEVPKKKRRGVPIQPYYIQAGEYERQNRHPNLMIDVFPPSLVMKKKLVKTKKYLENELNELLGNDPDVGKGWKKRIEDARRSIEKLSWSDYFEAWRFERNTKELHAEAEKYVNALNIRIRSQGPSKLDDFFKKKELLSSISLDEEAKKEVAKMLDYYNQYVENDPKWHYIGSLANFLFCKWGCCCGSCHPKYHNCSTLVEHTLRAGGVSRKHWMLWGHSKGIYSDKAREILLRFLGYEFLLLVVGTVFSFLVLNSMIDPLFIPNEELNNEQESEIAASLSLTIRLVVFMGYLILRASKLFVCSVKRGGEGVAPVDFKKWLMGIVTDGSQRAKISHTRESVGNVCVFTQPTHRRPTVTTDGLYSEKKSKRPSADVLNEDASTVMGSQRIADSLV